ncbi:MAG: ATP-binding protein [Anaerolineae bacterium]|nr:ATP-binding protein [Anaerolineae bacterium]
MSATRIAKLEDTSLWQRLNRGFSGADGQVAGTLAPNLIGICNQAYNRMKGFPSLHPEYTLHDEVHLIRVTELMSKIMPTSVFDKLNPVEITLLILAAHYHDQGMVLEKDEIDILKTTSEFKKFQDNWEIEHPNLKQVRQHLNDESLRDDEQERYRELKYELKGALLTDYIRETHGQRSAEFVRKTFGSDRRWEVGGTNLAKFVARLCLSHVKSTYDLTPSNGFRYDEVIGHYKVNMVYLGLILRLADILDFDRERTPDELYRTIDFRSNISLIEWAKHRSVESWIINSGQIQFTMRCEHPEYQRAAYRFIDWIDQELANARDIHRSFPAHVEYYQLDLPLKVDRSRIEPKDNAYIYHDLEFSLSRDDIVKLLMTDELYGSPSLCIRELLQNSLDALRYRQALIKRNINDNWHGGEISMQHELDEQGHELIRCTDNGAGMDEAIIERFLTRVGRSYYRSPEFEQERISFRAAGVDFDPCSQFGIGFMSCFMLGDHIIIYTRRDYGPSRGYGPPLIIEINGLGSIVVIREGEDSQPVGTSVEITGRKKPSFLDKYSDQVKLVSMVRGYALACEFPIRANCTIEELAETIKIPPKIATPRTLMEISNITTCKTIEQDFSEIDPLLGGCIRASFLINNAGHLVLDNDEASWKPKNELDNNDETLLVSSDGKIFKDNRRHLDTQTCIDGILVAGMPGREAKEVSLGWRASPIDLYPMSALLDIRGQIKPPLTPARFPPRSRGAFSFGPRWDYIQMLAERGQGRLWEQIASQLGERLDDETFWQLAVIYGSRNGETSVFLMRANAIWSKIAVPIVFEDKLRKWIPIHSLNAIELKSSDKESYQILYGNEGNVGAYETLTKWLPKRSEKHGLEWSIKIIVATMSTVTIKNNSAILEIQSPTQPNTSPWEFVFNGITSHLILLPYSSEAQEFFSVHMPVRSVNRSHPLVKQAQDARYREAPSDLQNFALSAIWTLSTQESFDDSELTYGQLRLGNRYKDVDWSRVDTRLHPPYTIRLANGEITKVTSEDFEHWAKGNPTA